MKVEHRPWTFPTFWFIKVIDQKYAYNYRWTCNYIILNNLKKILQTFQLVLEWVRCLFCIKFTKYFEWKIKVFPVKRKAVLLSTRIHYASNNSKPSLQLMTTWKVCKSVSLKLVCNCGVTSSSVILEMYVVEKNKVLRLRN